MFTLISADDCASSRTECIKLLESFGASVILEDADGWGVLKCRVDEIRGEICPFMSPLGKLTSGKRDRDHHPKVRQIPYRVPPSCPMVHLIHIIRLIHATKP